MFFFNLIIYHYIFLGEEPIREHAFHKLLCPGAFGHYSQNPDSLRDGPLERISLYADNTLLYFHDAHSSLRAAFAIFDEFGKYLGIQINWNKAVLFPLDLGARETAVPTPLLWAEELKSLGSFFHLNSSLMLQQLKEKCILWSSLSLNLMRRIHFLKIIFLPKLFF